MTRCAEFWHKWRKEPNFCGLSPQAISEIKGYLELVDKLKKTGIEEDAIYENCPSGACRPLLRLADDDTRTEGMNYIVSRLKKGKAITQKDLQETLNTYLGKEAKSCKISTQMRTDDTPTGEKEPQKLPPEKCFSPQPGSVPVTDTPPQPSLKEQMGPITDTSIKVSQSTDTPPRPKPAPCLSGQPCPDGIDHTYRDKEEKVSQCLLWKRYLNQLPKDECYLDAKSRREAVSGFTTALELAKPLPVNPLIIKPVEVSPKQAGEWITAIVRGYLTKKSQEVWESIKKSGELGESDLDIFQGLIDEAGERMGA